MDSFGGFGTASDVEVDVLTDAYRISGTIQTRFSRVTDILNQQAGTHITITRATISEHADPAATVSASSTLVAVSAILVMSAPALTGGARVGDADREAPGAGAARGSAAARHRHGPRDAGRTTRPTAC